MAVKVYDTESIERTLPESQEVGEYVRDKVTKESLRAQEAEKDLGKRIDEEVVKRTDDVTDLSTALSVETARAKEAEGNLQQALQDEVTRATGKESDLAADILKEATAREDDVNVLNTNITNEHNRAFDAEQALDKKISDEIDKANQVHTELTNELDTKLDKVTDESDYTRVYGINPDGTQTTLITRTSILANSLVMRDASSRLFTADPTVDVEAANKRYVDSKVSAHDTSVSAQINAINEKIPNQASAENQLADKAFVNSSITNMAARYMTPTADGEEQWASLEALRAGPWYNQGVLTTPTTNDYAIYTASDNSTWRGSFDGTQWNPQYQVNDTPFTAEQVAAINSGATKAKIDSILTKTSESDVVYGNDSAGTPTTYPLDDFATSTELTTLNDEVVSLMAEVADKQAAKPDGTNPLIVSNKVSLTYTDQSLIEKLEWVGNWDASSGTILINYRRPLDRAFRRGDCFYVTADGDKFPDSAGSVSTTQTGELTEGNRIVYTGIAYDSATANTGWAVWKGGSGGGTGYHYYSNEISATANTSFTVDTSKVTLPNKVKLQVGDILVSSNTTTLGYQAIIQSKTNDSFTATTLGITFRGEQGASVTDVQFTYTGDTPDTDAVGIGTHVYNLGEPPAFFSNNKLVFYGKSTNSKANDVLVGDLVYVDNQGSTESMMSYLNLVCKVVSIDEDYLYTERVSGSIGFNLNFTQPEGAMNGTFSQNIFDLLNSCSDNFLILDKEFYRLEDGQHDPGYLIYSHVGHNSVSNFMIKCITITVSTRSWSVTSQKITPVDSVTITDFVNMTGTLSEEQLAVLNANKQTTYILWGVKKFIPCTISLPGNERTYVCADMTFGNPKPQTSAIKVNTSTGEYTIYSNISMHVHSVRLYCNTAAPAPIDVSFYAFNNSTVSDNTVLTWLSYLSGKSGMIMCNGQYYNAGSTQDIQEFKVSSYTPGDSIATFSIRRKQDFSDNVLSTSVNISVPSSSLAVVDTVVF